MNVHQLSSSFICLIIDACLLHDGPELININCTIISSSLHKYARTGTVHIFVKLLDHRLELFISKILAKFFGNTAHVL